jgi:hypothetical protein
VNELVAGVAAERIVEETRVVGFGVEEHNEGTE